MDSFKRNQTERNQEQSSFNYDITELQKQFDTLINNKGFPVDKILVLLREIKNFSDLQRAINNEVTRKLPSKEIINWQSIKFLFLTDENAIKILTMMSASEQKLDETKSKMIYPNIKKILLKNDNDATNLIKYIQREQIMYFDKELLKKIPIDNMKKFTPAQINYLTPEQFEILLDRKDCSEYICNDIGFRKIPAHQTSIISKLPYRKVTELTEDEINSLNIDSVKIILKKLYDTSKIFNTLNKIDTSSNDKNTKSTGNLHQDIETLSNDLREFQETLQTSSKFLSLRNLIPAIINIELKKMKDPNATQHQITENLDYLIYHIDQEQIQNLDDYVLTNLPKESILKFNPQQAKSLSSTQCLTLLKREDCSDYIIDNLTAEQIYNMDLKNISELPNDTIKKFITKHQKFLFVDDVNDYLNNLNVDYRDKNNQNLIAEQYGEEYSQKCDQFNKIRKNIMLLLENLLDKSDLTDFILPMLQPYHFRKLSKESLKKLIEDGKLNLKNQKISDDVLKTWFGNQLCIYPSQLIDGEWICDRLQDLTDENYQLAHNLINQALKNKNDDQKVIWPYLVTILKKATLSNIQEFNKNLLTNEKNEENKTKLEKSINTTRLQVAGKEIAENLSSDAIKLLTAKPISLIIQHKILKYFSEDRINFFSHDEISKLEPKAMENLSQLATKIKETEPRYQEAINKFLDTYISDFGQEQLKSLFKNGNSFLLPDTIQKIKPEILFSDNEDYKKNILWKINVMNLDFSKFEEPFCKNNFLTVDACKKFSSKQIEELIKSEKIEYLDPEFLVGLSSEQIGIFNTEFLTKNQISKLMEKGKFEYLNNVTNLDFSKFEESFYKDNFLTVDVCKKFSSKQIEQLVKSEKIKYFDPEFLVSLSEEQIGIFNTEFLTEYQISILMEKEKFKYLNTEIIKNNNLANCLKRTSSYNALSYYQQKKLINHDNFRSLSVYALQKFNSDLIVEKFNSENKIIDSMTSEQNLALIDNLTQNNKIKDLNPDVIKMFTTDQIKKLGQCSKENKDFTLTDEQIEVLVNNNQIRYFDNKFVASKLAIDQIKNISSIIKESPYKPFFSNNNPKFNITIGQFIALSNTNKFCYIPTSAFNSYGNLNNQLQNLDLENATAEQINILFTNNNLSAKQIEQILNHKEFAKINSSVIKKIGKNLKEQQLQNLDLENATAEQINILFTNNNLSAKQIEQILNHKEFAKINSSVIKKIGNNLKEQQLQNLDLKNVDNEQLENFFAGCRNNNSLNKSSTNNFFESIKTSDKIDIFVEVKSFQSFYLDKQYGVKTLDEIILRDTKSDFKKNKLFLRMVQNKLSIPESKNQANNFKTNNLDTQIQPQMKKSYKKFIKSLSNEEIKSFCLNEATENFVDYLPVEKLAALDLTANDLSKPVQKKLKNESNRIKWWIKFWSHVPFIGRIYQSSKKSLLENINKKLISDTKICELNPILNKTKTKINNVKKNGGKTAAQGKNNNGRTETNYENKKETI